MTRLVRAARPRKTAQNSIEMVPVDNLTPDKMLNGRSGKLLVSARAANRGSKIYWLCICDCGNQYEAEGYALRRGVTTHCGCDSSKRSVAATKHGGVGTRLYRIWKNMLRRCDLVTHPDYPNYGGRGITVCAEWRDFCKFRDAVGVAPSSAHQLDREDNDKGYYPGNTRWATQSEQMNNTRANRIVTIRGVSMTLKQATLLTGVPYKRAHERLQAGMTVAKAIQNRRFG